MPSYCGFPTNFGHGDNAICGQPYDIDGIYQCPSCKLKDFTMFTQEYAELQRQFHKQRPDYGVSGSRYTDMVADISNKLGTRDILDYGCGKATLSRSLPFPIQNYDPFIPEYSTQPSPADLVVCTDVMEHVEEEHIEHVLKHINSLTKKLAFFQIATRPASKTLPDGRNAHISLFNNNKWMSYLLDEFEIEAFQAVQGGFFFLGVPRK